MSFIVTAVNTGNLILQDSYLTSPQLGALNCTQPVAIPVRGSLQCTAASNFDQDDMEQGDQTFNAWGESPTLLSANNVSANPKVVQVLESPQLVVDVVAPECIKPARMRECALCLRLTAKQSCFCWCLLLVHMLLHQLIRQPRIQKATWLWSFTQHKLCASLPVLFTPLPLQRATQPAEWSSKIQGTSACLP